MEPFVTIARIIKVRGLKGEVEAEILTDFPDRFEGLERVRIKNSGREDWETIEKHWFHKGRVVLRFSGRTSPEQVQELVGADVQVPESEIVPLPEDTFFHFDLLGCQVLEGEEVIGRVVKVMEVGREAANLVVETLEQREIIIPLVREFVRTVDIPNKRIHVDLPEGLLQLSVSVTRKTGKAKRRRSGKN